RPLLFGTTQEFLRCFGVEAIAELPEYDEFGKSEEAQQLEMELEQMSIAESGPQPEPVQEVPAQQEETEE
ncbi:MAG: hypothetical protein J6A56_01020, partial [Clostridia bacterium]|nr:hypothetical protein [Clostridia bacterium]